MVADAKIPSALCAAHSRVQPIRRNLYFIEWGVTRVTVCVSFAMSWYVTAFMPEQRDFIVAEDSRRPVCYISKYGMNNVARLSTRKKPAMSVRHPFAGHSKNILNITTSNAIIREWWIDCWSHLTGLEEKPPKLGYFCLLP